MLLYKGGGAHAPAPGELVQGGGVHLLLTVLPARGYKGGGYVLPLPERGYDKLWGYIKPGIDGIYQLRVPHLVLAGDVAESGLESTSIVKPQVECSSTMTPILSSMLHSTSI